jgi:pimeloyl-ACP methyl ester carboxylesterase
MQRAEYKKTSIWELNVRYVDTGEAGDGPVVVLLHGLADSLLSWCCNFDFLADAGYRVIAPDLPGFGESDKPSHLEYDPGSTADFVYDFCQKLGIEELSLVGNSAGGLIAGLFALEHPADVEKLVLVDSGGFGRKVSWLLRVISVPVLGDFIFQPKLNSMMGLSKRLFYKPPAVLEDLLPERDRLKLLLGARMATLKSIRASINLLGLRQQGHILDRLKLSDVPLLVVWGANDVIIPVSHAKIASQELPRCNVQVIPECGHWPQMEKSSVFNPIVTQFLSSATTEPGQSKP